MKYAITFILMLSILASQAQQIELNYSKTTSPFIWTISHVEFLSETLLISIRVKNTASDTRVISFANEEYVYFDKYPIGIKAINNSLRFNSNTKNISLKHNDEISFILTFPRIQLAISNKFSLKLATHFTLNDITIPDLSLSDVNQQMQTWEQFYNAHRKVKLTYKTVEEAKIAILQNVENWQKKGEFESTLAWQNRVNDKTRQEYISDITSKYSEQHKQELNLMRREQVNLAEDYEAYKENLLTQYYRHKIIYAMNAFISSSFELRPYDADNETFLLHSDTYGDILLPVPIKDAPLFKQNWTNIRMNIKPEFVPNGENVALSKLLFTNHDKIYTYDSHTIANYAISDVNYNFDPVEIAEINFADLEIDGSNPIPKMVSSAVVGLNNQGSVLSHTHINPSKRQIHASDKSDVDIDIPKNSELKNSTTFAVIIANEKYNSVSSVPYAENDGTIFSKYLTNTLGLPSEHVKIYKNATFGNIVGAMKHINNLSLAFDDKLNLIFYYAGHGVPNEQTKKCMILPVDGDTQIPETCYDVDKLYTMLGKLNANSIIVMLDACFSGAIRGDGMLCAARSVKIKSNLTELKGNMVIISASQGDETAFPFEKEQHGMFTYYLLKCLQENNGNVTLGELSEYIINHVKRQSVVANGKLQTPMVQLSPTVENHWRSWKLTQ